MTPRVVFVTGASSGIGKACAETISGAGHIVYGTSRRASATHAAFHLLLMDVTCEDSVRLAVDTILQREGRIDVVVNNAGYGLAGPIEETTIAEAAAQLDVNFFGALRVIHAVLPSMRARRDGLLINVSSLGGLFGLPFQGIYAASKFALEGLTDSLRMEVKPFGIRATLVEPGDIRTQITSNRVVCRRRDGLSPYEASFAKVLSIVQKEEDGGASADSVARLVLKLLNARSPAVRYTVGHLGQTVAAVARRLLPSQAFEAILCSHYGISGEGEAQIPLEILAKRGHGT